MTMLAAMEATSNKRNSTNMYEDAILPEYNVTTTASGAASKTSHFETDLHGNVNILLGGAMLSGVIMVVLLMCYCCHKSIRKNRPQEYPQYWRTEPDVHSLEVFTTEAHAARRKDNFANVRSISLCKKSDNVASSTFSHLTFEITTMTKNIEIEISRVNEGLVHSAGNNSTRATITKCCERQSTGEGNLDESTYGALSCPVTPNSGPGPPPTYDSLIFDSRSLPNFIDKKPEGAETPGIIIPPMVSTLLSLSTTVRSTECNEATEQEISDEGLPSYEAALKLDANGYV
ncbi:uncharacterized protein LOC126920228 isoform X2 [Bombus affinis]|nr:uncharacterized protein LOC126920228 isoform X2 [Bombus affinis]